MKHNWTERIWFGLFRLATILSLSILAVIGVLLAVAGGRVISPQFIFGAWQHRDLAQAGVWPAIVGSFTLGVGVIVLSFPLGLATAIYLTEYSRHKLTRRVIQLAIRNLAGVPSVVYGLFGLSVFVYGLGLGSSLAAAVLTLAVMTLPWIVSASVEALTGVSADYRLASASLGASQWQTIWRVVLPAALPGCLTGGIIGVARAMGETAPIIIVGATFFLTRSPRSPLDQFMALPYHTFILATQHASPLAPTYAAATALVLIGLTFILSLGAFFLRAYYRQRRE